MSTRGAGRVKEGQESQALVARGLGSRRDVGACARAEAASALSRFDDFGSRKVSPASVAMVREVCLRFIGHLLCGVGSYEVGVWGGGLD
jgi:hypothetical protein